MWLSWTNATERKGLANKTAIYNYFKNKWQLQRFLYTQVHTVFTLHVNISLLKRSCCQFKMVYKKHVLNLVWPQQLCLTFGVYQTCYSAWQETHLTFVWDYQIILLWMRWKTLVIVSLCVAVETFQNIKRLLDQF